MLWGFCTPSSLGESREVVRRMLLERTEFVLSYLDFNLVGLTLLMTVHSWDRRLWLDSYVFLLWNTMLVLLPYFLLASTVFWGLYIHILECVPLWLSMALSLLRYAGFTAYRVLIWGLKPAWLAESEGFPSMLF